MGTHSGAVLQRPATPSDLLRSGLESNPDALGLVSARTRLTWQTAVFGVSVLLAVWAILLIVDPHEQTHFEFAIPGLLLALFGASTAAVLWRRGSS